MTTDSGLRRSSGRISRRSTTAPNKNDSTIEMTIASQVGTVLLGRQYVRDERREHRHLALREVEVTRRLVDQRERERHRRVDRSVVEGVEEALQEQSSWLPHVPRYARRIASSRRSSSAVPLRMISPVSST